MRHANLKSIEYIVFNKWVDGRGESLLEEQALRKFCNLASSSSSQQLASSNNSQQQLISSSSNSNSRQQLGSILEVVPTWYNTILVRFLEPIFGLSSHSGNLTDSHLATALAQSSMTDFGSQFRGLFEIHLRTIL